MAGSSIRAVASLAAGSSRRATIRASARSRRRCGARRGSTASSAMRGAVPSAASTWACGTARTISTASAAGSSLSPRSGYSRDHRGDRPQIVIGLMCAADGCPVAVEVFEGNTADPLTLSSQIDKLKQRFKLQRVVMVGDRGLLTSAPIEQTLRPAGLGWITALRAPAIKQLAAEGGPLQPSLFDDRDMAEITSPDYPGERLGGCQNPLLAEERARKRAALLAATEKE